MKSNKAIKSSRVPIYIFKELKDHLRNYNIETVAEIANMAPATLYFWLSGRTHAPRLLSVVKVADAIGLVLTLERVKFASTKRAKLKVVK